MSCSRWRINRVLELSEILSGTPQASNEYTQRRMGKIILSKQLYEDAFDALKALFQRFTPLTSEYMYDSETFLILGVSPDFEPIDEGTQAPIYHTTIKRYKRPNAKAYYKITFDLAT